MWQARGQDQTMLRTMEYQATMKETCRASPKFPACISNEEYLANRLTTMLSGIELRRRAAAVVPWAIALPVSLLIFFYALRWGITGRVRPLWLL
jgi:hypothetical protein